MSSVPDLVFLSARPRQEVGAKVHGLDVERRHDDLLVGQGGLRLLRQLAHGRVKRNNIYL